MLTLFQAYCRPGQGIMYEAVSSEEGAAVISMNDLKMCGRRSDVVV